MADTTYLCLGFDFNCLSLITDAYSKNIVGYHLYSNLSAEGSLLALAMAVKTRNKFMPLIDHSNRETQFCNFVYVSDLRDSDIATSMTEDGEGYKNQIAERMNGILKTEFNPSRIFPSHEEAKLAVVRSIQSYNTKKPHLSLDLLTPFEARNFE